MAARRSASAASFGVDLAGAVVRRRMPALVVAFGQRVEGDLAVSSASRDHRHLAAEIGGRLGDAGQVAEVGEGAGGVRGAVDPGLPLAVVAAAPGLQEQGRAQLLQGGLEIRFRFNGGESHGRQSGAVEEGLLLQPVLRHRQGATVGRDLGAQFRQALDGGGGDVLELEGDDVAELGEALQRGGIVVLALHEVGRHPRGGRVRVGIENGGVEAQPRRGQRQHPSKLSAAQHADGGAGRQGEGRHAEASSTLSGTPSV